MKVWHDDIRVPPDDTWTWVRTNSEAKRLLEAQKVNEINMDYDLGLEHLDPAEHEDADFLRGQGEETGGDLARWMVKRDLTPPKVVIHSWSQHGRDSIQETMQAAGVDSEIKPFDPTCRR